MHSPPQACVSHAPTECAASARAHATSPREVRAVALPVATGPLPRGQSKPVARHRLLVLSGSLSRRCHRVRVGARSACPQAARARRTLDAWHTDPCAQPTHASACALCSRPLYSRNLYGARQGCAGDDQGADDEEHCQHGQESTSTRHSIDRSRVVYRAATCRSAFRGINVRRVVWTVDFLITAV